MLKKSVIFPLGESTPIESGGRPDVRLSASSQLEVRQPWPPIPTPGCGESSRSECMDSFKFRRYAIFKTWSSRGGALWLSRFSKVEAGAPRRKVSGLRGAGSTGFTWPGLLETACAPDKDHRVGHAQRSRAVRRSGPRPPVLTGPPSLMEQSWPIDVCAHAHA